MRARLIGWCRQAWRITQRASLLLWLISDPACSAWAQTSDIVRLDGVAGAVQVTLKGATTRLAATNGMILNPGDSIQTGGGSRATLRLGPATVVPIGPNSRITIEAPSQPGKRPILDIINGVFFLFSRDRPGQVEFKTRQTSGATRGTEFVIDATHTNETRILVLEGEVETSDTQPTTVASGSQLRLRPGAPPERSPILDAVAAVQWNLYYPGVLNPADAPGWSADESRSLAPSLEAYRRGNLVGARAALPEAPALDSNPARVYAAAVLLSSGEVPAAEALLAQTQTGPGTERLAASLRAVIAAVQGKASDWAPGQNATATEWLAYSYLQQSRNELEPARESARQATQAAPDFGFAWARLAELEFSFGRIAETGTALDKAMELSPENAQAVALAGFVAAANNRLTEASEHFQRAIVLDGALGNAWLGRGLVRIRQGDVEAGREDLQVAAAREPRRSLLRSYLGKAFQELRQLPEAEKELAIARELDSKDPTPLLYQALLFQQQNRPNEAIEALEQSAALNKNRRVYRSRLLLDQDRAVRSANLAAIYQDAGLDDAAVREASRGIVADYANASAHLFLAQSYDALRDPRQVNLRYESAWLSEYLVANLLAPVSAGALSQSISQQEYGRLFDRRRFGLRTSTEYRSRGDWEQGAVHFGNFDRVSYALETTYRSERGDRPNQDMEQITVTLQWKQQITPKDTLYLQGIFYDFEAGDVGPRYRPEQANPRVRLEETQDPILVAGWNHEWSERSKTLVLAAWLEDELGVVDPRHQALALELNPAGNVIDAFTGRLAHRYRSDLGIVSGEVQHLLSLRDHTLVGGTRLQHGRFETLSALTSPSGFFVGPFDLSGAFPVPADRALDSVEFNRWTLYLYDHWRIADSLLFVAGLTYDTLSYPANHRLAPLSPEDRENDQLSPKAGLVWTPWTHTTFRAAWTRSMGGVSFDQSFQLEPTQVAGFVQTYRSLIPEALSGAAPAATFETWNLAWDQKFPTRTYVGVSASWLESALNRDFGVFPLDASSFSFYPASIAEHLDYRERGVSGSISQLLGDHWSVGAHYRIAETELEDRFAAIPTAVAPGAWSTTSSTLQQGGLFALLNLPCGFFARADAVWTDQSNAGYSPALQGEDLWQFHAHIGYRFAQRRAEVRLGVLNITDQDYRLNPLSAYSEPPRERTLTARLRFNF